MTLRTTIISTSRRVDFEIPAEMVGKELEIIATKKKEVKTANHWISSTRWPQLKTRNLQRNFKP
jgi:hypothetical protein